MPYIQFIGTATVALVCPLPLILDTFTAVDGTDPTTRDLNTHPAITGVSRWRFDSGDGYSPGVINSNRLEPETVADGFSSPILFLYGDGNEGLTTGLPVFVVLKGKADAGFARLLLYSDGGTTIEMMIARDEFGTFGGADSESSSFYSTPYATDPGEHTIGVFMSDTRVAFIVDGVVVASDEQDFSDALPLNFIRVECPFTSTAANTSIDCVAVYSGITLAQAIALTDGTCPIDSDADVPTPPSGPFFLDFEGALVGEGPSPITDYYDTAPHDYGVVFSGGAAVFNGGGLIELSSYGDTVLTQDGASSAVMTVAAGFVSPLEFGYVNNGCIVTVRDGSGSILASEPLFVTFGSWTTASIIFSGVGTSVEFDGESLSFVIDGMTINPAP